MCRGVWRRMLVAMEHGENSAKHHQRRKTGQDSALPVQPLFDHVVGGVSIALYVYQSVKVAVLRVAIPSMEASLLPLTNSCPKVVFSKWLLVGC